jgi:tRNA-dihydrouridine synthase B
MLKIGNLELPFSCMLAPLAGISDLPFRLLNRSFGCGFAFTEMISARALVYSNRNTLKMVAAHPEDTPLGAQLLSEDPEIIRRSMDILRGLKPSLIDLNAACPVSKVTKRGEGAGLLREPSKLRRVLKALVENSHVPVTVKIRSGWDEQSVNAKEIALYAREAGIHGLFIHGRTKVQGYRGGVDYDVIRQVKESLDIPVIASGDALSPGLIKKMFDETGCDGIVIARGALGNPWIFGETAEFLRSCTVLDRPDAGGIADTMLKHLNLCVQFSGEKAGTITFRKFFAWYIKGLTGSRPLKEKAFRAASEAEMRAVIEETRTMKRRMEGYEL